MIQPTPIPSKDLFRYVLIALIISTVIVLILRYLRTGKSIPPQGTFIDIIITVPTGFAGLYVFYQIITLYSKLFDLIGEMGITTMIIGGVVSIRFAYVGLKKIISLD
jgi:hypothetical protein